MRKMRWDCNQNGCFRKLCPKLGVFDECFPGKIGMSDIDGVVEISGNFLFMEWKSDGGALRDGQRIMFERMSRLSPMITVIVVFGDPEEMSVESIQVFEHGSKRPPEPCSLDVLKDRIKKWTSRALRKSAA